MELNEAFYIFMVNDVKVLLKFLDIACISFCVEYQAYLKQDLDVYHYMLAKDDFIASIIKYIIRFHCITYGV